MALIGSRNQTILTQREPTVPEWMAIVTPILCLRLIDIFMKTERIITHSSGNNASYSADLLTGDLKKPVGFLS